MELNKIQTRLKNVACDLSDDDIDILSAIAILIKQIGKKRNNETSPQTGIEAIFATDRREQHHQNNA